MEVNNKDQESQEQELLGKKIEELQTQLEQQERLYSQEKQKWILEKHEYQKLCAWYANSYRYRLGGIVVEALRNPLRFLHFPKDLFRLVNDFKKPKLEYNDVESCIKEESIFYNKEIQNNGKRNILYIIHAASGGTVKTNEDLMEYISQQCFNVYLLRSTGSLLTLYYINQNCYGKLNEWKLQKKWEITEFYSMEFQDIYKDILREYHIELVHIRHLFKHGIKLVDIYKENNIPVVMSFHDFYYICPTMNLVNTEKNYCMGVCGKRDRKCKMDPAVVLKCATNEWVCNSWRQEIERIFEKVDVFVTTSLYVKNLYESIYPLLKGKIQVIEHGRDFAYPRDFIGQVPKKNKKIKILLAGNIDVNKGESYIEKLIKEDTLKRIEFHCIGMISERLKKYVRYYGKYHREDFRDYVEWIKPSYVGIFSIWPETYCHVLTEAWSCGIPCIVSNIGTLQERTQYGGAIRVPLDNLKEAYKMIIRYSDNVKKYQGLCEEVQRQKLYSVSEMSQKYIDIYKSLLNKRT